MAKPVAGQSYIDLHCHILPDLDDGPADVASAIELAKVLNGLGFGSVVATPHALPQFPGVETARQRREELAAKLASQGITLSLYDGAENRLSNEFLDTELGDNKRHLNGTSYVLVEAPYETIVPALPDILFRLRRKGIRPLFAHPERCAQFQEIERAEEAVRLGAFFQLDIGSLVGRYGRPFKKAAERLLDAGLYVVAATDAHKPEDQKWLAQAMRQLEKAAGKDSFERLVGENPARLLQGEELI